MFHSHYAHKKQDWNYDVTALFRPHQDISAVCGRSVQIFLESKWPNLTEKFG